MLILFNKPYGVLCQFTDRSTPPRRGSSARAKRDVSAPAPSATGSASALRRVKPKA